MAAMIRADQWVVTYEIEHTGGMMTVEFYRGDKAECLRIAEHSMPGECHWTKITSSRPVIGRADDWDAFLQDLAA